MRFGWDELEIPKKSGEIPIDRPVFISNNDIITTKHYNDIILGNHVI